MAASYTRNGQKLYRSRQSLAEFFGYSERQVGTALQSLVDESLLMREERRGGHRAYTVHEQGVRKKLAGTEALGSFECFLKHSKPLQQEKTSCSEWEKSSSPIGKKVPAIQEESSYSDEKKVPETQEKSSPHNILDTNTDKSADTNDVASASEAELIELVLAIFFFKNNCRHCEEAKAFIGYYKTRNWRLSGGKVIASKQELLTTAESWQVQKTTDTGRRDNFMKGWGEVYKIAPADLKRDCLDIRTPTRSSTSSNVYCSARLAKWLDENRDTVKAIFCGYVCSCYKIQWSAVGA